MAWTHTRSWQLAASPATVFAALTDAAQLREWFAEHTEVSATPGGDFRFWGRRTLGAPSAQEATQRISALTPGEALDFSWTVLGVETSVSLRLAADPGGTRLELSHTVQGELPLTRSRELIDDHWQLQFGNLAMHLAGGTGIFVPDFTDPRPEIHLSIDIEATRDRVFRTLIEPALVNQWFGSTQSRVAPAIGGEYWIGWEYKVEGRDVVGGTTKILEFVKDRTLVLDWLDWRGDPSVTGQRISFTLEPLGKGTRVRFVHGGFSRTADLGDYPFGWVHFLDHLKQVTLAQPP